MAQQTDPAKVVAALKRVRTRNDVRQTVSQLSPAQLQWGQEMFGRSMGAALPRDPAQFLEGTFTPLTPIEPVAINWPQDDMDRPEPRQREMPPGWNMPVGQPGTEGFKLASFGTLRTYADIYSVARACIQVRKGEIRGLEWDIMPTERAEKQMRGDTGARRDFEERKRQVVRFFRKPDPDYLGFGSYIDAVMEEMLVTDALSLYLHPTQKKGGYGPFGKDIASLEIISGSTIRPLVNSRGGRVRPPSPGFQQYLYGVPRVDLMQILEGIEDEQVKELGKPAKVYRGDQLMYLPYTQRSWTPYGFPPLERTLIPTITGLRKQQYQLDYFDEGTIPGNYISPGENVGWTPNQLQIWQDQQNALAGDPAYKHKSIALPPGSKVFPMRPVALADQFDEIIMSQVCMGYDVMPMEMGISPKVSTTQSPGAANQMAKATEKTNERKSLKPTLAFLTDIFNLLIQVIWQQEDMRFVFEGLEEDEDENQLIERLVQMLQYGLASVDECRIALGKPPWGLPITSDPVYINPTAGMVPLGSIDPLTGKAVVGAAPPAAIGAPPQPGGGGPPGVAGPPKPAGAIPAAAGTRPPTKPDGTPGGAGSPGAASSGSTSPGNQGSPGGPPSGPQDPREGLHPDDKVGQARQDTAERHAELQDKLHEDFAAGKPMAPPVRPPISDSTEDPDHPDNQKKSRPSTKAMLSELDALCRHACKGRPPETWEPRHLPEEVLSYYTGLTKHLSPNDAAAVTHDFIVMCFGPPTIVADLEGVEAGLKTFSTSAPLNSQDGQQGLAPLQMDSSRPVCSECNEPIDGKPHRHKRSGAVIDNGATVDQRPGPMRADRADMVVKAASDAGPKAPLPLSGRVTRDWPGWKYDLRLAALYAGLIEHELGGSVDPAEVARSWLDSNPPQVATATKGALSALGQLAWGWMVARGYDKRIQTAVARVLGNLWAEGFAVGRESGREMLDSAYDSSFWSNWRPGDPDAARLAAGSGLQRLLQSYGIATIRSVTQTRMTQLANVLADGFTRGDSPDTIAEAIKPVLRAPQRARMIATTELARATTQAAVAEYRAAGMEGKRWSVTGNPPDGRVCPRCKKNGDQGAIAMSLPFESGDEFTPGHPECRCAILPEPLPADTSLTPGVIKSLGGLTGQQLLEIAEDLGKGLDLTEILKYVAPGFMASEMPPKAGETLSKEQAHYRDESVAGQRCGSCTMFRGGRACTLVEGLISANMVCDHWYAASVTKVAKDGFVAGGLAVRAADTGRVFMIQRAHDEDDPAGGYWEFPGGRLDDGESVGEAARREWAEETGLPVPAGRLGGTWDSGPYRGHVLHVESEDACPILDREKGANPDDPDNDSPEAVAWWDPAQLKNNPMVRPELREHPKRVRRALECEGGKVNKGVLADLAGSMDEHWVDDHNRMSDRVSSVLKLPTGRIVYEQLLRNYPPHSIEWVKRATWRGPYLVGWDKIDHDDMDSWAASHEPEHVKRFEEKIEAGEQVNPVVLVADPDGNFIDVDGHHRALAYHQLKRPIRAWVGRIDPADRKAMEETHLDQIHEGASLQNKMAVPAGTNGWHDAWMHELRAPDGRWVRGGEHFDAPASSGDSYAHLVAARSHIEDIHYSISAAGRSVSDADRRLEHRLENVRDELAEGSEGADWGFIRDQIGDLKRDQEYSAARGKQGDTMHRLRAERLSSLVESLEALDPGKAKPKDSGGVVFRVRSKKGVQDFDNIYDARAHHTELSYRGHRPKLGYAPGHDARHVSQLAKEVKAGTKSRQTAFEELQHSAALREKLTRQLDGGPVKPKPTPRKPVHPEGSTGLGRLQISDAVDADKHGELDTFIKESGTGALQALVREAAIQFSHGGHDEDHKDFLAMVAGKAADELAERDEKKLEEERRSGNLGVAEKLAESARTVTAQILGVPESESNHRATKVLPTEGNANILATMGWDGNMKVRQDVIDHLSDVLKNPDATVSETDVDSFLVLFHESLHAQGQGELGSEKLENNRIAYANKNSQYVEEGTTELGSTLHARKFLEQMGIADRRTGRLGKAPSTGVDRDALFRSQNKIRSIENAAGTASAGPGAMEAYRQIGEARYAMGNPRKTVDDVAHHLLAARSATTDSTVGNLLDMLLEDIGASGEPHYQTAGDLADEKSTANAIRGQKTWGHYNDRVAGMYSAFALLVRAEGDGPDGDKRGPFRRRLKELVDEVNRQGVHYKWDTLAEQALRARGIEDREIVVGGQTKLLSEHARQQLHSGWGDGPDVAMKWILDRLPDWDREL